MLRALSILLLPLLSWTSSPTLAAPAVVTDVPSTHSLVTMVMGTSPQLLLRAGATPHDYSMRPSEAASLGKADVVFWVSSGLSPWLPKAIKSLAPDIRSVELLETTGTVRLALRESATFDDDEHHHHDTDGLPDPHAWLNPANAQLWLQIIADTLSELDPEQSAFYQSNALEGIKKLEALDVKIVDQLSSVKDKPFIVFHDSYHYLEDYYDLPATATISLGDGTRPGIRQINALRAVLKEHPDTCIFSEPQFSERLVDTVIEGSHAKRGVLDPLGATLTPGPDLYAELLQNIAQTLHDCLSAPTNPD
ncbi:High-affinity zinc uptake system protein ZnuA [Granulosicoccus antarcticus IMCC3135]|uniref:High-affinity zinc uptake system protein ZnuA n=2 Tax=Granulosicoccus TaxID=437504 RepID=A0A2Z2NGY3_9GAMM|nr:High-affinity zinc uptake system protein ZnuA [Granulosicoccus antarcticus IMCC3135]